MPESPFPHLQLVAVERGDARLHGGGSDDSRVKANKAARAQHFQKLTAGLNRIGQHFQRVSVARAQQNLPIPIGIPFVLEVAEGDEELLDFLTLKLGIELVAEFQDGFLMVAARDVSMAEFNAVLLEFQQSGRGSARAANVLEIHDQPDYDGRLRRMLGEQLFALWPFDENQEFILEASFKSPSTEFVPVKPTPRANWKPETNQHHYEAWERVKAQEIIRLDNERALREQSVEDMIRPYGGAMESGFIDSTRPHSQFAELADSFSVRIRMSGKGFKDLVLNHPHLFEVSLPEDVSQPPVEPQTEEEANAARLILQSPTGNAKAVCVIDSGIQENHRLLANAIDADTSRSFLPNGSANDVADYVGDGGHGTRVAGVALYGAGIPSDATHAASFWIQNARVLDANCKLPDQIYPPVLLREVVRHFRNGDRHTRIYNHSITGSTPSRRERMSAWGAEIDHLSHAEDVLLIQAIGNLHERSELPNNPGICNQLDAAKRYPDYLLEDCSRLANPSQSLQALTVGSIALETFQDNGSRSLSSAGHPSSFTRCGFGLWNAIKPDVVEIGGDFAWDGSNPANLTTPPTICPLMVRSTLNGGPAISRDTVGSSFAAPRVAHIAGILETILPEQPTLLYRALIAQSARWPDWAENSSVEEKAKIVKKIGYGLPDLIRATSNSEFRVTCITQGAQTIHAGEAAIYAFYIPEELRRQALEAQLRLDITLSYSAEPRRTRTSRRGYLGVWLDWACSHPREPLASFRARTLRSLQTGHDDGVERWNWSLHERDDWGEIPDTHRGGGSLQKDWVYLKPYDLPEVLAIAVRGHKGWAHRNPETTAQFSLAVSLEAVNRDLEIYTPIQQRVLQQIGEIRLPAVP